jgi:threonine/homoserine/homoserine lactone efflux protein
MPDLSHWGIFLAATFVLLLVPGPSVIYVLTQAIDHGYRGAVFASVGLALGDLLQVFVTVLGLSALLSSSIVSFHALKYAGASYLIFLGVRRFARNDDKIFTDTSASRHNRPRASSLISQAFFALNPKTALFFLALFPQLIDQTGAAAWIQMLWFGCAFSVLGFTTNALYGCIGGRLALGFTGNERMRSSARYATAGTLILLGLIAAVTR